MNKKMGNNRKLNQIITRMFLAFLIAMLVVSQGMLAYADPDLDSITAGANISTEEEGLATSYLVQYYPGREMHEDLQETLQGQVEEIRELAPQIDVISFEETDGMEESLEAIEEDPAVKLIEPNYPKYVMGTVPNDPLYASQWALTNLEAPEAWEIAGTLEKNVVVAVIDTGVDISHPDLSGRIAAGGKSFVNGVQGVDISDQYGHGTSVAGMIAAASNNGLGMSGVAGSLDVKILPIKIYNDATGIMDGADMISAINYAVSMGVDVINMSIGGDEYSAIENNAVQAAIAAGVTVVASSGNNGDEPDAGDYRYPASFANVISVGSIDNTNLRSDFSNFNDKLTVVAPGEDVVVTRAGGGYSSSSGTSFSAPAVAAVAAVLKGENPTYTPAMIKARIESTAIDLGTPGYDDNYGYGKVNFSDVLRSDSIDDGSDGVIDSMVFDLNGTKVIAPIGGLDGYAYAYSTGNDLYTYLCGGDLSPVAYGICSGTKFMLLDGDDGYDTNFGIYATAAKAMHSTPLVESSETANWFVLQGFNTSGAAILVPFEE